jgi:hypothetical protein
VILFFLLNALYNEGARGHELAVRSLDNKYFKSIGISSYFKYLWYSWFGWVYCSKETKSRIKNSLSQYRAL